MQLHEAISVTYALMGQELSDAALKVACHDLRGYPVPRVLAALERCRKECKHIALVDIITRIEETKALALLCWRCTGGLEGGRTMRQNRWICNTCEKAYQDGKWEQIEGAPA